MTQSTYQTPVAASINNADLILEFEKIGIQDVPQVGGKNASLGEMIQQLTPQGVRGLGAKGGNTYYANFSHAPLPTGLSEVT